VNGIPYEEEETESEEYLIYEITEEKRIEGIY